MFASILKLAAWLGLTTARAGAVVRDAPEPQLESDLDPMPACRQKAWRRSGRHSSPLAERGARRSGRTQLMVLAGKSVATKAARRPKSAPRVVERRPKPCPSSRPRSRYVWLASRSPAAPCGAPAKVIALQAGRSRRAGNPALRVLAAA